MSPNVLILPINIFPNTPDPFTNPSGAATNDQIAEAIDWSWNQGVADVLSNSWGGGAQSNNIDAAIGRARTQGRNNRGCPVVFASGNSNPFQNVLYPANLDGVITVGACNNAAPSGDIWYYSDRGASMDLVAPSGDVNLSGDVTTTDRMGADGYEGGNYTQRFGGTSAACPQVSGIAALMLSVNPTLTETQVRNILQTTATDMGATGFDNTFGFGRANAAAAVNQALSVIYNVSGDNNFCTTSNNYTVTNLPIGATVQWQASPTGIVTVNSPNSSQTTLSKNGNGVITLTATLSNFCGAQQITLSKQNIRVGAPDAYTLTPTFTTEGYSNWLQDCNVLRTYAFPGMYSGNVDVSDPVATSYTWTFVSKYPSTAIVGISPNPDWQHVAVTVKPQGASVIYRLTTANSCGSYSHDYTFVANGICFESPSSEPPSELSIAPNPVTGSFTATLKTENKAAAIKELIITNKFGAEVKHMKFNDNSKSQLVNIQSLPTDVYVVQVFDGERWLSEKITKQ